MSIHYFSMYYIFMIIDILWQIYSLGFFVFIFLLNGFFMFLLSCYFFCNDRLMEDIRERLSLLFLNFLFFGYLFSNQFIWLRLLECIRMKDSVSRLYLHLETLFLQKINVRYFHDFNLFKGDLMVYVFC